MAVKDSRDHKQAHGSLLQYFPHMPEAACLEILEHGFQKGSGRVGRSRKLEDRFKIQLAVNAHIRHRLTQYDSILKDNKDKEAKFMARDIVRAQVQAIANSWRGTASQKSSSQPRSLASIKSAATLIKNRQRRAQQREAQIIPRDAQVLDSALDERSLNEVGHEATVVRPQANASQCSAHQGLKKAARIVASGKAAEDLFRPYELTSSSDLSKEQEEEILRVHKEGKEGYKKGARPETVPRARNVTSSKPMEQGDRTLKINASSVESSPRETNQSVTVSMTSNNQPYKPHALKSDHAIAKNADTGRAKLCNDVQLKQKRHDNSAAACGPSQGIDRPSQTCGPSRRHYMDSDEKQDRLEDSRRGGRSRAEDSEWVDIDDITLRTARVHLA